MYCHRTQIDILDESVKSVTKKLAICVPYRNREQHLNEFVPSLTTYLSRRGIEHKIFVAHQADTKLFNRGKIKNIAFDIARSEGYDYFCFHDIDMIPEDDSCDYSYCPDFPVHISYYLSDYGYTLPYLENFGGALMFTKEQFEQVNGYYNDYWDWGAEDDDLFWRCRRHNLLDIDVYPVDKTQRVARFNGVSSKIEIPYTESLQSMMRGSYTFSMLVKTDLRHDVAPYLRGKSDSTYLATPLLSKGAFDQLVWVNTNVLMGYHWNSKNEPSSAYLTNTHGLWQHVICTVDCEKGELRFFLNGYESPNSKVKLDQATRHYFSEPFLVGSSDSPSWDMGTHSHFKGEIADIAFWNRPLSSEEITSIYANEQLILPDTGMILHYDFSNVESNQLIDLSGNGNTALITDIDLLTAAVTNLQTAAKPHRRRGRYRNLPHQTEGIANNTYVKGGTSARNEEILVKEVMTGELDTSANGLSTLEYKEIGRRTIFENHLMIDVEC